MLKEDGRQRVTIEGVTPEIDAGRYPVKRVRGESVVVEADIFGDGHDEIRSLLRYRREESADWHEVAMEPLVNDRWRGEFRVTELGRYRYSIMAWIDHFATWRRDLAKRVEAGQDVSVELLVGAEHIERAAPHASGLMAEQLHRWAGQLRAAQTSIGQRVQLAVSQALADLMHAADERAFASTYTRELVVVVDRERACYSTWYEMFPRSSAPEPGRHGTFRDCEACLPYVASMGFDVLYLPPIHPIGTTYRKGRNNATMAGPDDPGSPWGIGSEAGGHMAVHPELGTLEDFRHLVLKAREYDIDLALDLAFQCSPDHPYVRQHPEWFRHRPDGTIQYAENPPKKYQDIYPIDFETEHWQELWEELKQVVCFWVEQGVRIFRVDNPHTKPFRFWEWLIDEVKRQHPEVIFLAEAFTRPKVMYNLAKRGFSQSYTYFAWRNTQQELVQYLTTLTQTEVSEYFRPNLWPNTPDILTEYLQLGVRPAFMARLVLAATLGASYGIYGPAFELGDNRPREPGSEEYWHSEKYELKHWPLDREDSLKGFIARVNRIRQENPALHRNQHLRFHPVSNEQLLCYSKHTEDHANVVLTVVNLDPHHTQSGWVELVPETLDIPLEGHYQVHDLLSDSRYLWHGRRNFVELTPGIVPAHIFRLRRRVRTERDFEYFL